MLFASYFLLVCVAECYQAYQLYLNYWRCRARRATVERGSFAVVIFRATLMHISRVLRALRTETAISIFVGVYTRGG